MSKKSLSDRNVRNPSPQQIRVGTEGFKLKQKLRILVERRNSNNDVIERFA